MYMLGTISYTSVEEAKKSGFKFSKYVVLEEHKDGTACVVHLSDRPIQPGQAEYIRASQ